MKREMPFLKAAKSFLWYRETQMYFCFIFHDSLNKKLNTQPFLLQISLYVTLITFLKIYKSKKNILADFIVYRILQLTRLCFRLCFNRREFYTIYAFIEIN